MTTQLAAPATPLRPHDYLVLPHDLDPLCDILNACYHPSTPEEAGSLESLAMAFLDWRLMCSRRAAVDPGGIYATSFEVQNRRAAALHVRQRVHALRPVLRKRFRQRTATVADLRHASDEPAMPSSTPPTERPAPTSDGLDVVERELLEFHSPTDPCEAMAVGLVAQAQVDCRLLAGRRAGAQAADAIVQKCWRMADLHLQDMQATLRRIQRIARRAQVKILAVRMVSEN